jgi:hypothetical protein
MGGGSICGDEEDVSPSRRLLPRASWRGGEERADDG